MMVTIPDMTEYMLDSIELFDIDGEEVACDIWHRAETAERTRYRLSARVKPSICVSYIITRKAPNRYTVTSQRWTKDNTVYSTLAEAVEFAEYAASQRMYGLLMQRNEDKK